MIPCRRWRNFWLPFRKKLIINNRLCPCIFLAPATHEKATFASIVFSANTAMPIQIFPMKNATSYPCMLSSPIRIFYFLICKRNFHPNAFFFVFLLYHQRVVQYYVQLIYPDRVQATSAISRSYWSRFPAVQQIRLSCSERGFL